MNPIAPYSVTWYITKRCNLTCTHCFNYEPWEPPRRADEELDFDDAKAIVDQLADAGVFSLAFGGGEPLTLPWFVDLVEYCDQAGIDTFLSTNGALLDRRKAERLAAANVTVVQLSLDGATKATHDAIRGPRNFDHVMRAAGLLEELGIDVQFAFTLMKTNQDEIDDLLDLCIEQRVPMLKLQLFLPTGRAAEDRALTVPPEQFRAIVDQVKAFERASGGKLAVDYPCFTGHMDGLAESNWRLGEKATKLSCGAGTTRAVIFEDGSVGTCEFMRDDSASDLRKESFLDVWHGGHEAIERWRRLNLVHGKCGSCGYQSECGYGCRANAYFAGGDFYGDDPSCIASPPEGVEHPHYAKQRAVRAPPNGLVQIGGLAAS
ncbi:MAG: radical SAM protein [Deltaproteobacteria bacterium]